jgi:hypothetical protein
MRSHQEMSKGPNVRLERISKTYHGTPYGGRPLGEQSARSSQRE